MSFVDADTVSVAIPVYNGERYLAEALSSVQAQTVRPGQVLVFDNASTDLTRDIASEILSPDCVITASQNQGAVVNFNRAVRESSGTYFAWLAADDRLSPAYIERTLSALRDAPEAAACLSGITFIDPDGRPCGEQRDPLLADDRPAVRLRSFLRRPRWTESYCLYRREELLKSPMFADSWGADVLLTWWFVLRAPLVVIEDPVYEYRTYPVKVAQDVAAGLSPRRRHEQWRMCRLWLNLWRSTRADDLPGTTIWTARRELVTALASRHWIKHLTWDVWMAAQSVPGLGWVKHLPRTRRAA